MRGYPIPNEDRQRIMDTLLDGHTVTQAAKLLGISRGSVETVARRMRAEGVRVMRSPNGRKPRVRA